MRIVATPAYQSQDPEARSAFQDLALATLGKAPESQPSMVFGDPAAKELGFSDLTEMADGTEQYLSAKVPVLGTQELWCKRDDYPDGPVYTFLLPSDY